MFSERGSFYQIAGEGTSNADLSIEDINELLTTETTEPTGDPQIGKQESLPNSAQHETQLADSQENQFLTKSSETAFYVGLFICAGATVFIVTIGVLLFMKPNE